MTRTRALDAENRKGTILGLTMAETILLVLFCMFLALMTMMARKYQESVEVEKERDRALARERELSFLLEEIEPQRRSGEKISDAFNRLYVPQEGTNEEAELIEIKLALEAARQRLGDPTAGSSTIVGLIDTLETSEKKVESLEEEKENMKAYYEKQLGKGYGPPPCWIRDGKPVYTFDVKATSYGYVISRINNPDYDDRPEAVLAAQVTTGSSINERNFVEETAPLKEWADQHDCVFYVRIEDKTKAHEKMLWKRRLGIVEGHFYKYLVASSDGTGDELGDGRGDGIVNLPGSSNNPPGGAVCSPQDLERALAELGGLSTANQNQCVQE